MFEINCNFFLFAKRICQKNSKFYWWEKWPPPWICNIMMLIELHSFSFSFQRSSVNQQRWPGVDRVWPRRSSWSSTSLERLLRCNGCRGIYGWCFWYFSIGRGPIRIAIGVNRWWIKEEIRSNFNYGQQNRCWGKNIVGLKLEKLVQFWY